MVSAARSRLGYANVMATLAVFIALGGTSYAALSITGRDVKDGSLTGRDVKDHSLGARDLKPGVVPAGAPGDAGARGPAGPQGPPGPRGPAGSDAPFTGAAAGGALAGTYPNPRLATGAVDGAAVADGSLTGADLAPSAFDGLVHGRGQILTIDASAANGTSQQLAAIPGELTVSAFCNGTGTNGQYAFTTGGSAVTIFTDNGGADPTVQTLSADTSAGSSLWATNPAGDMHTFSARTGDMTLTIWVASRAYTGFLNRQYCAWQGHVLATTG